jgi:hypothetical protein
MIKVDIKIKLHQILRDKIKKFKIKYITIKSLMITNNMIFLKFLESIFHN